MKDDEQQRQYQQVSNSSHRKTASIPLFCLLALVGIKFLLFCVCLFDIFSQEGAQGNEQHQIAAQIDERCDRYKFRSVWKNWSWNFRARIKCLLDFLNFFEITAPSVGRESYVQFFESFVGEKIHLNRSSERKVMPILRRIL
jgi:hypothetical protein